MHFHHIYASFRFQNIIGTIDFSDLYLINNFIFNLL